MRSFVLADPLDFDGWREAARRLRLAGVEPAQVRFVVGHSRGDLFDEAAALPEVEGAFNAPRAFMEMAAQLIQHRSEDRFDLMYRLLWRLKGQPDLLAVLSDRDMAEAADRVKAVRRAAHKMKAFVRFRQAEDEAGEHWVAWFEPAHRVLQATAPFFVRRFSAMRWTILTPDGSAHWNGEALACRPAAEQAQAPTEDAMEDLWRTYYASTFNPARLRPQAMQSEMPKRYWKNLPEAALIPELMAAASVRTEAMVTRPTSRPNDRFQRVRAPVVDRAATDDLAPESLDELARGVQGCRRCPLWRDATQGVCGEGPKRAALMVVGEQPGDQEDLVGRPFVGPAGRLLGAAFEEVGLNRRDLYLTNAVKHFKHEPRGKRRLHKTPNAAEVQACRWWLDHERRLVKPRLILALGATAGLAVLGRKPAVQTERGRVMTTADGARVLLTVHPAYLLRLPDPARRDSERARFLADLAAASAEF
ncbi:MULTISPECIES: UdgX family uracil-DNA binding protein [unclassified Brevundimonas]|uniref:UdgX family uracil-DNA binding protein n=1 Tax=unclassified Brevundimonas TaxID=2622653 RepID=UPI000E7DB9B7|nr:MULTISPECIES: UdgX family uracil-DNA binding protein [unclassified Brevundimonas]HBY43595.1 uracil-DNA glycosylase [Brevundimonas sp.]